ncbi:hypothetical protein SBC2_29290 [Caballeronia sp. SBC2]|nr:hypothetical protein SBC2_29290 [Caballeronia sp. SBC2]
MRVLAEIRSAISRSAAVGVADGKFWISQPLSSIDNVATSGAYFGDSMNAPDGNYVRVLKA